MITKECAECHKEFIIFNQSGWLYKLYKDKMYYYCSYKCWRKNGGDAGAKYHRARK